MQPLPLLLLWLAAVYAQQSFTCDACNNVLPDSSGTLHCHCTWNVEVLGSQNTAHMNFTTKECSRTLNTSIAWNGAEVANQTFSENGQMSVNWGVASCEAALVFNELVFYSKGTRFCPELQVTCSGLTIRDLEPACVTFGEEDQCLGYGYCEACQANSSCGWCPTSRLCLDRLNATSDTCESCSAFFSKEQSCPTPKPPPPPTPAPPASANTTPSPPSPGVIIVHRVPSPQQQICNSRADKKSCEAESGCWWDGTACQLRSTPTPPTLRFPWTSGGDTTDTKEKGIHPTLNLHIRSELDTDVHDEPRNKFEEYSPPESQSRFVTVLIVLGIVLGLTTVVCLHFALKVNKKKEVLGGSSKLRVIPVQPNDDTEMTEVRTPDSNLISGTHEGRDSPWVSQFSLQSPPQQ